MGVETLIDKIVIRVLELNSVPVKSAQNVCNVNYIINFYRLLKIRLRIIKSDLPTILRKGVRLISSSFPLYLRLTREKHSHGTRTIKGVIRRRFHKEEMRVHNAEWDCTHPLRRASHEYLIARPCKSISNTTVTLTDGR